MTRANEQGLAGSLLSSATEARCLTAFLSQEADTQISAPRLDRVTWTRFIWKHLKQTKQQTKETQAE